MDCYDQILAFYGNKKDQSDVKTLKVWLNQFLIKLMRELEISVDYLQIRNCLILLINLFFNIKYPDHYHSQGTSYKKLAPMERKELAQLLKEAYNN